MGQLNSRQGVHVDSNILKKNACVACHKPPIEQFFGDNDRQSFDYYCRYCNSQIQITDLAFGQINLLENNPEARERLKEEIKSGNGQPFRISLNVVQYFLGNTKHKPVTYREWMDGNLTGNVNNWPVSDDDLLLIKMEQKKIFENMVSEKFEHYKASFEKRRAESISPAKMLLKEIADVTSVVEKGKHKFEGKPTANEIIKIGAYSFRTYSIFTCVQDMYEAALDGSIDLGIVPSENQKVAVAAMNANVDCMAQAIALGKLLEHLSSLVQPAAAVGHTFDNILNNASFGDGNIFNMGSGSISDVRISIRKGDFGSVRTELARTGLDEESITELEKVIDDDDKDDQNKKFGTKVKTWMGKAFMKAVEGSWKIGQSAAGKVLADTVMDYYGWS